MNKKIISRDRSYLRDGRAPKPKNESISRVMSANKGKNTSPEIKLRKGLWKKGLRGYRLHWSNVPGRPDIAYTKKKLAIFVNGCFWHRCSRCDLPLPKSNKNFWKTKFKNNKERDKKKNIILNEKGWKTITVWECEINNDLGVVVDGISSVINELP